MARRARLRFEFERMNELWYFSADDEPGLQGWRLIQVSEGHTSVLVALVADGACHRLPGDVRASTVRVHAVDSQR